MKFEPPIPEREIDELIGIANYPDRWQAEAVELAKAELLKRGVSDLEQQAKFTKWEHDNLAALKYEFRKRALVKYNPLELFFMFLQLPGTILWGWYLKQDGYLKMHKQRLWVIAVGIMFYVCSILYVVVSGPYKDEAIAKEIQKADITEWEKSYYGEIRDTTRTED